MSAIAARFTLHVNHAEHPIEVRLRPNDETGNVGLSFEVERGDAEVSFYGDPATILEHLDAGRRLVIDHLVDTVGIPATVIAERQLLADILREIGADLPSPLAHRIRSTIAGDQPEPTGRTTVAALAERQDWVPSHLAAGNEDALTVECLTCHGSGLVTEQHDYATEQLGCQDCEGSGRIPENLVAVGGGS